MALPIRFPAPVINTDFFLISTMRLIYPCAPTRQGTSARGDPRIVADWLDVADHAGTVTPIMQRYGRWFRRPQTLGFRVQLKGELEGDGGNRAGQRASPAHKCLPVNMAAQYPLDLRVTFYQFRQTLDFAETAQLVH